MSRCIDADGLIADMQERHCKPCKERKEDYNEVRCRACWVDDATDEIDGFADNSLDIVRCKECKHWDTADGECYADRGIYFPKADDFCSYGERREP